MFSGGSNNGVVFVSFPGKCWLLTRRKEEPHRTLSRSGHVRSGQARVGSSGDSRDGNTCAPEVFARFSGKGEMRREGGGRRGKGKDGENGNWIEGGEGNGKVKERELQDDNRRDRQTGRSSTKMGYNHLRVE